MISSSVNRHHMGHVETILMIIKVLNPVTPGKIHRVTDKRDKKDIAYMETCPRGSKIFYADHVHDENSPVVIDKLTEIPHVHDPDDDIEEKREGSIVFLTGRYGSILPHDTFWFGSGKMVLKQCDYWYETKASYVIICSEDYNNGKPEVLSLYLPETRRKIQKITSGWNRRIDPTRNWIVIPNVVNITKKGYEI